MTERSPQIRGNKKPQYEVKDRGLTHQDKGIQEVGQSTNPIDIYLTGIRRGTTRYKVASDQVALVAAIIHRDAVTSSEPKVFYAAMMDVSAIQETIRVRKTDDHGKSYEKSEEEFEKVYESYLNEELVKKTGRDRSKVMAEVSRRMSEDLQAVTDRLG